MRRILSSEIKKEVCNAAAFGAFNRAYGQFIKMAKKVKTASEFVSEAQKIKNVPNSVATRFNAVYGKGGASISTAAQRFIQKHGNQ